MFGLPGDLGSNCASPWPSDTGSRICGFLGSGCRI